MSAMTIEELEGLPVVFSFETACRAISVGRNQGYRLLKQGQFPVRVTTVCGRHKVSKYDLLTYLGAYGAADIEQRAPDAPSPSWTAPEPVAAAPPEADRAGPSPPRPAARPTDPPPAKERIRDQNNRRQPRAARARQSGMATPESPPPR